MVGVYQIINLVNGKIYVGRSSDVLERFRTHRYKLKHNIHTNFHLQASWNEYGEQNFDFEILQIIKHEKDLMNCEQFWINRTGCLNRKHGYNKNPDANGSYHTEESKRKISQSKMGHSVSLKTRQKISKSFKGKKLSEEQKQNISKGLKKAWDNNRFQDRKEIQYTKELRQKMSEAQNGQKNHFYGKNHTEESKQKMSTNMKGRIPWNKDLKNSKEVS